MVSVFGNVVLRDVTRVVIIPLKAGCPSRPWKTVTVRRQDAQRYTWIIMCTDLHPKSHTSKMWKYFNTNIEKNAVEELLLLK